MLSAFHHLSSSRTSKNLGILASLHPGAAHSGSLGYNGTGGGGGAIPRLSGLAAEASAPPAKSWLGQEKRRSTGIGWVLGRR